MAHSFSVLGSRLLRLNQILGDVSKGIQPIFPVSESYWWAQVKSGRFPRPVRIGRRVVAWRESDILTLLDQFEEVS